MTSRTDAPTVLVVGGGIGGVATALACARRGISVRVLERAAELNEIGAGLQLGPNGVRILRDLDVLDVVERSAVTPRRAVMLDVTSGEEIYSLDFDEAFVARFGARYTVMHRGDLFTTLLDAARATGLVDVLPGKQVLAVEQDDDGARAHCADGTEYRGAVLVGADGLHSVVRKVVIADDEPLVSDYVVYRGPGPRPDGVEDAVMLYTGDRHHLMQYPMQGGEMLNRVMSFKSVRALPESEDWGTPDELAETYADACEYVQGALREMDTSKRWFLCDRAPVPGWSQGRVTLLGDAAHAMRQYLAQGAVQALEDAAAISAALAENPDDLVGALKSYEAARYPRASAVQRNTRFFGELTHLGGIGAALRNYIFSQLPRGDFRFLDWLYGIDAPPPVETPSWLDLYDSATAAKV